jgi:peptide/nickel transport system substrate-binding protein
MILREAFDYPFSRIDPTGGAHIDPPSVAIYETIVTKAADWWLRPTIAERLEPSADGLEWTVELRPGVRFHSGAPCDAPAVHAALERVRAGEHGEQVWYWDPVDSFAVTGPNTLVFRLHYPYSRLPSLLWGTHTAIHNDALREQHGDAFGHELADGTGPFRLSHWSPERVVAERFDGYHGGPAPLEGIEWIAIKSAADRLAALEAGEVHCLHGPPYESVERLRADPRFEVIAYPQASNIYLGLDFRRSDLGFDDLRVRLACSLALDREQIARDAYAGYAAATFGPLPPGDEYYDPSVEALGRHDPAEAAALLDAAGFVRGADGIRERDGVRLQLPCVNQDDEFLRRVGDSVARQLRELGIALELEFVEPFAPFYDAVGQGPPSFVSKWLWQDPMDAIIGFSASWGTPFPNWQHASVPALDAAFGAWLRAGPREELAAAAASAQRAAAEGLPYVPLLTPQDVFVRDRRLRGWEPYPANLYPFYDEARLVA